MVALETFDRKTRPPKFRPWALGQSTKVKAITYALKDVELTVEKYKNSFENLGRIKKNIKCLHPAKRVNSYRI